MQYFDAGELEVKPNDYLVAEWEGEERVGRVIITPDQLVINQLKVPLSSIIRKATTEDLQQIDEKGVRP